MSTLIQITYTAAICRLTFSNHEKALAAYAKISNALKDYRAFKNDNTETVEVETDDGKSMFKLERMDAILIDDGLGAADAYRELCEFEKKLQGIRAEMGLPELSDAQ